MYSTLAFVVPVTLLRLPYSLASALAWAAIVYYPVNMAPEAGRFFTFILLLFLLHKYGPEHIATTFCGFLCVQCNAANLHPTMRAFNHAQYLFCLTQRLWPAVLCSFSCICPSCTRRGLNCLKLTCILCHGCECSKALHLPAKHPMPDGA